MTSLFKDAYDYFDNGHTLYSRKDYDKSIILYTRALCNGPDERVYHNFAVCHYLKGDYHKAIKHYTVAIAIKPNFSLAYNGWGFCLANFGRFEEAIEKFKKAVEADSRYTQGYLNWGLLLYELKEEEEAIKVIEKGLEIQNLSKEEIIQRYKMELTSAEIRLGKATNEKEKELLKGQIRRFSWMIEFIAAKIKKPERSHEYVTLYNDGEYDW